MGESRKGNGNRQRTPLRFGQSSQNVYVLTSAIERKRQKILALEGSPHPSAQSATPRKNRLSLSCVSSDATFALSTQRASGLSGSTGRNPFSLVRNRNIVITFSSERSSPPPTPILNRSYVPNSRTRSKSRIPLSS